MTAASDKPLTQEQQDEAVLEAMYRRIRYACMEEAAYLCEQLGAEGYGTLYIGQAIRELSEK